MITSIVARLRPLASASRVLTWLLGPTGMLGIAAVAWRRRAASLPHRSSLQSVMTEEEDHA